MASLHLRFIKFPWLNHCPEGRDLAKHFNCRFIETSAKQRINVDEAFSNLVREIRRYNKVSISCEFEFSVAHMGKIAPLFRSNKPVALCSLTDLVPLVCTTTPMAWTRGQLAAVPDASWREPFPVRSAHHICSTTPSRSRSYPYLFVLTVIIIPVVIYFWIFLPCSLTSPASFNDKLVFDTSLCLPLLHASSPQWIFSISVSS